MLGLYYRCLLRLHPHRFRERFGQEMLSIFDDTEAATSRVRLAADVSMSLMRQWIMRPQYGKREAIAAIPIGVPSAPAFFTLGDFKPRKSALFCGAALTLSLYCSLFLVLKHSRKHYVYLPPALSEWVVGPDTLESYAGVYASDLPSKLKVLLMAKNGELVVEMPREWKTALIRVRGNRFCFSDAQENWIEFSKHGNGVIYGIRVHRNGVDFQAYRATR